MEVACSLVSTKHLYILQYNRIFILISRIGFYGILVDGLEPAEVLLPIALPSVRPTAGKTTSHET